MNGKISKKDSKGLPLAAIDIGSNTIRLVCAECNKNNPDRLKIFLRKLWVARLGESFDSAGYLVPSAIYRAVQALKEAASLVTEYNSEMIDFVTTGVVREASNKEEFLEIVKKESGMDVRVLKGEEEAELTLLGVRSTLPDLSLPLVVCDIGGGSTEIALLSGNETARFFSIPLGAIRLIERFQIPAPMKDDLDCEVRNYINKKLADILDFTEKIETLVATAGTPTTLASIDQALKVYDPLKVHGYRLEFSRLREIYQSLVALSLPERKGIHGLEPGREDIIVPGTAILSCLLQILGVEQLVVSEGGLLEGVLAQLHRKREGISPKIFV